MYCNLFIILICLIGFSIVLCNYDNLAEGSECVTEEGMKGTCVDIRRCMQYVQSLKNRYIHKTDPQMCFYKADIPIVCCTDCELVNDTQNVVVDRFGLHYFKTGKKAHDKCLEYIVDEPYPCNLWGGVQRYLIDDADCYGYTLTAILAVAGGLDAVRGQYPHMERIRCLVATTTPRSVKLHDLSPPQALLGFGDDVQTAEWLCGGTLISHRYILTAAHCMSSQHLGPVRHIALGILKRTDPPEIWKKYTVKEVIVHPEYKPPSKYHDVALLVTNEWIKFTHVILPACLDTGDTDGTVATATGWGSLGHRQSLADNLQTVVLRAYSEAKCAAIYPPHRLLLHGYNHTTQMCYGDKDQINDTCEGDSGGPLQVQSELSSCVYTVLGVTSHGKSCGFGGGFGVYSRVSYYVPWIESIVWP